MRPLYPSNNLLAGKWQPTDSEAIVSDFPSLIRIPAAVLEF
ncbi:hypothetical protein [Nocardia amikacinitolerans]|nr:hypothetical protein [Nocardia amikacinitolerans]